MSIALSNLPPWRVLQKEHVCIQVHFYKFTLGGSGLNAGGGLGSLRISLLPAFLNWALDSGANFFKLCERKKEIKSLQ